MGVIFEAEEIDDRSGLGAEAVDVCFGECGGEEMGGVVVRVLTFVVF